jgi:hypothetical protein
MDVLCKRQGVEWVADQLLPSEVGLLCVTLLVIKFSDFDSYSEGESPKQLQYYQFC